MGRQRLPQDVWSQPVPVPGQLARGGRVLRHESTMNPCSLLRRRDRLPHKRENPVPVLPRVQPGPSQGTGPSFQRPYRPAPQTNRTGHEGRIIHSPTVEIPVRTSGEYDVSGPESQTTHPPPSVLCPEPVDSGHAVLNPDTPDPECPESTRVVARPHQPEFRSAFLHSRPGTHNSDGCLLLRVRRSPGRPNGFWHLVRPVEEQTHQLAGAPGSVVDSQALPGPGSGPSGGIPIGQLHHSLLHQQAGGDTLSDPMPPGPGHVGVVRHATS